MNYTIFTYKLDHNLITLQLLTHQRPYKNIKLQTFKHKNPKDRNPKTGETQTLKHPQTLTLQ